MTTKAVYHVSEREMEALRLAAQGLTSKQIAERMGLRVGSIDRYMSTLARVVGCTGRTALAVLYTRSPESFVVEE